MVQSELAKGAAFNLIFPKLSKLQDVIHLRVRKERYTYQKRRKWFV